MDLNFTAQLPHRFDSWTATSNRSSSLGSPDPAAIEICDLGDSLAPVAVLYEQARAGNGGAAFVVGVSGANRKLLAYGKVGTFAQLDSFTRQMEGLGYTRLVLERADEMHGCDALFVPHACAG